ncbi:cobalamin biosynthesis protein CobW [Nodosilinea sp. LEGE 07088]|uniref:GTP-binding protein n=1 Tax=Nodosilinea sp. LEGE 07088 TaxID=2777968 RepID=UPI001880D6F8|nr:GTP-binding protein [Nodosilinea sp. LEGE 07088]MBE9140013.1 cobalamin biosynthesis protein CobW [Nodosilinea sp. LEGE 07088]
MITVVAGPCGAGKTTWILQELAQMPMPAVYIALGADTVPIDATRVTARFPQVEIFHHRPEKELLQRLAAEVPIYFELGFQLETDVPLLEARPHRRVALVAEENRDAGWQLWADEVICGNHSTLDLQAAQLWRAPLTGQVFDPPSLDEMLIELTGGAYGNVHRVKGIFELPDGRAFHVDFVKGLPGIEYTELNLPHWRSGRPDRFSGIEVVGWNLEQETIAQTVRDGCLSDGAIAHYQEQYKALISDEINPEESVLA